MKTLLFFGTYNPLTMAHINIGLLAKEKINADRVVYVPSKDRFLDQWKNMSNGMILPGEIRAKLMEEAFEKYGFEVERCELDNIVDGKTYNTMKYLKEKSNDDYYLCFGTDKVIELDRWYKGKELIEENNFVILERADQSFEESEKCETVKQFIDHFTAVENNSYQSVSSTIIRRAYIENRLEEVKDMIPENVFDYLSNNVNVYYERANN